MRTLRVLVPGAALLVAALTAGCAPAPGADVAAPARGSAAVEAGRAQSAGLPPVVGAATARVLTPLPAATSRADRSVVAATEVAVHTAGLPAPPLAGAPARSGRVTLDLLGTDVPLDLTPSVTAGGPDTWHGTPAGGGTAVLVAGPGGSLAGTVDAADGFYRLTALGGGVSRVERIDRAAFPEGDGHVTAHADGTQTFRSDDGAVAEVIADGPRAGVAPHTAARSLAAVPAGRFAAAVRAQVAALADTTPVIDVLVGYSTAAKNARGGQAAIEADIDLGIAQTNEAFSGSGVQAQVRLTRAIEVPGNGDVTGTNLGRLRASDGWNDQLLQQREADGADLVSLVVDDTANQACGVGYLDQNPSQAFESYAFTLVDTWCSTGNYSFTHELGHNFGSAHDRGAWSGTPAYSHGYGYVDSVGKFRTVMAYPNACSACGRILRFSNPAVLWNGRPTGVPIGAANAADNASSITSTAPVTAAFRGVAEPATVSVTVPATVVAPGSTEIRWATTGYVGPSFVVELVSAAGKVTTLSKAVAPSAGRLAWNTSQVAPGAGWTVRVRSAGLPALSASSAPFAVVTPSISLADAAVSGSWAVGVPRTVTWTYTGAPLGKVLLELVREGVKTVVIAGAAPVGTAGAGSFTWTPPSTLPAYGDYTVRASLISYRGSTDTGPALALTGGPALGVTSQPADTTAGGVVDVAWSGGGEGVTGVKAEVVHVATGRVVATLATNGPATGTARWAVPASAATGTYRVRLAAVRNAAATVGSDTFTVDGTGIGSPAASGAGAWTTGTPRTITWATTGTPGSQLKLELVGGDGRVTTIAAAAPLAPGALTWTPSVRIPPRPDYTIRATVVGNTLVTATSTGTLTLVAPVLQVPAPATVWTAGTAVDVAWNLVPGAPVDLRLVRGRTVVPIADRALAGADGNGRVTWRVPLSASGPGWAVRVTASENAAITVTTSGTVTVALPSLRLVAPGTSASWTRGATVQTAWAFGDGAAAPVSVTLTGPRTFTLGTVTGTALSWKVPATAPAGVYTLRVRPSALGTSPALDATTTVAVG